MAAWTSSGSAAGLLLLGGVSACLNDAPVSPAGQTASSVSTQTVTLPPSQSFFLAPPVEGEVTYYSTGITVPKGMSARMRIDGVMTAEWNPQCGAPLAGSLYQVYFTGSNLGGAAAPGAGAVKWFLNSHPEFPTSFEPVGGVATDGGMATWSPDLSDAHGALMFRREPIGGGCSISGTTFNAWFFSGGQTVDVHFATMDVGASKTSIHPNEVVTFTAAPVNFSPADANAVFWVYYPDGQQIGINIDSCAVQTTCTYTPPATGRMMAINEAVVGFSPTVMLVDLCPTGDTILDSDAMRNLMKIAWDSSNASDSVKANRRERGGYVFRDSSGNLVYRTYFAAGDTPCQANVTPTGTLPGSFVAGFHTHPFRHLEETTGVCSVAQPGVKRFYDAKTHGGPSGPDFERGNSDQLPMYILDKDNIYFFPVGTTKVNWKTKVKKYPRIDPTGCVRP